MRQMKERNEKEERKTDKSSCSSLAGRMVMLCLALLSFDQCTATETRRHTRTSTYRCRSACLSYWAWRCCCNNASCFGFPLRRSAPSSSLALAFLLPSHTRPLLLHTIQHHEQAPTGGRATQQGGLLRRSRVPLLQLILFLCCFSLRRWWW